VSDAAPPPPSSFGVPPPGSSPDGAAALSYGWDKFTDNIGPLLAIVLVPAVLQLALGFVGSVAWRESIALYALVQVVTFVVSTVAALGILRASLMVVSGERVAFARAFTYDRWGEWFVFSIAFGLAFGIGVVAFVIPGLVVLALFGLAPYYFVDQRMSVGDAFRASYEAARSKHLALPVLLCIVAGALGIVACGVGIFVTEPVAYIAVASLYRYAQNQRVA
jgi:uncharacterized membrane protein